MFQDKTRDYRHWMFGGAAFLGSLVVYLLTVQRTLSLWDCGEFIACSYTLGVAHPPGNPLFLLIGRIFTLLPIAADISHRVNLLSVVSGAAAATFGYAVLFRLIAYHPAIDRAHSLRWLAHFCSLAGALLFAFARTNWSNSVEAEVYAPAMLLYFAIIWLALKWYDTRETAASIKYFALIAYLGVLSIAVHMTSFLAVPVFLIFAAIVDGRLRRDPRFWISVLVLGSVTVGVDYFLVSATVWLVVSLLFFLQQRSRQWFLALCIAAGAIVGYTPHGYIPIRASLKPAINQNDPRDWDSFHAYIQRKQYGQESMFSKMFTRRASWENQFGSFPRIGFGGFLLVQYGISGWLFAIPALLVLSGIVALIRWKWKIGAFFLAILLAGTVLLVLYMNFADGSMTDPITGMNKLEVRDRDYFFTPGYITFALCIGLGLYAVGAAFITRLKESLRTLTSLGLGLVTLLFPTAALFSNYDINDRSDNFLAYDYAYNYLMSCPPDAVLFPHGDNDTFPLWCLQEVYRVRRDVRIANMSLLQTDWYQLQMKHEMGIPISFEDDQMEWLSRTQQRPHRPYRDRFRGNREVYLQPFLDRDRNMVVTSAHQMVENIIEANQWRYPLVFASMVPSEVRYPLANHILRRGWTYEIVQEEARGRWDIRRSEELFLNVYKARHLNEVTVYRDEVATTLIVGAAQTALEFADYLESQDNRELARAIIDKTIADFPEFWQSYTRKANIEQMSQTQADSLMNTYITYVDSLLQHNPDNIYYYQYKALALQFMGKPAEALHVSEQAYNINPVVPATYRSLLALYVQNERRDDAIRISREYLKTNPLDQTARMVASGQF